MSEGDYAWPALQRLLTRQTLGEKEGRGAASIARDPAPRVFWPGRHQPWGLPIS
jgi:hypothetical protein